MDGVGGRLRARAVALGLSDAEVARRSGLTPTRYGHYVTDYREPDLATLIRICRVLGLRPDEALGFDLPREDGLATRRRSIAASAEAMDAPRLDVAAVVMQALAVAPRLPMPQRSVEGEPERRLKAGHAGDEDTR